MPYNILILYGQGFGEQPAIRGSDVDDEQDHGKDQEEEQDPGIPENSQKPGHTAALVGFFGPVADVFRFDQAYNPARPEFREDRKACAVIVGDAADDGLLRERLSIRSVRIVGPDPDRIPDLEFRNNRSENRGEDRGGRAERHSAGCAFLLPLGCDRGDFFVRGAAFEVIFEDFFEKEDCTESRDSVELFQKGP